jgi:hypothetical protein
MDDPYYVDMDLEAVNDDYNSTSKSQLRFDETSSTPPLPSNRADYFCSLVRFNIQTGNTMPVFIPRTQTGQRDINKTIFRIAIIFDYVNGIKLE